MNDENIHVLGNAASNSTPLAAAMKIVEFSKRDDCEAIVGFGILRTASGRTGVVPMASTVLLGDMNMVAGCANAINNHMWHTSMTRATTLGDLTDG